MRKNWQILWWWFLGGAIVALAGAVLVARAFPSGTLWPTAIDGSTQFPDVYDVVNGVCTGPTDDSCVVKAAHYQVLASAVHNLEQALGADSTWLTKPLPTRLAEKAASGPANTPTGAPTVTPGGPATPTPGITTFWNETRFSLIDNTVVVNGVEPDANGDIGLAINEVQATKKCSDTSKACRAIIRPGTYSMHTPIEIGRGNFELDCQGSTITVANDVDVSPVSINLTHATAGTNQYGDGYVRTYRNSNITIRNCIIDDTAQFVNTDASGDTRAAVVSAYDIDNLILENVTVLNTFGAGIQARYVRGRVAGLSVYGTRANGIVPATGIALWGDNPTNSQGVPLVARNLTVAPSSGNGIVGNGIDLLTEAMADNVSVTNAHGACVGIGGSDTNQRRVSLSHFDLSGCAQGAGAELGAIDDWRANGIAFNTVSLSDGWIRNAYSSGIHLASAASMLDVAIDNVQMECLGLIVAGSSGLHSAIKTINGLSIRNSSVRYTTSCSAGTPPLAGITIDTPTSSGTVANLAIANNEFDGNGGDTAAGSSGVYLHAIASPISNVVIAGNHIRNFGNAAVYLSGGVAPGVKSVQIAGNAFVSNCAAVGSTCGAVQLAAASGGSAHLPNITVIGNVSSGHPQFIATLSGSGNLGYLTVSGNDTTQDTAPRDQSTFPLAGLTALSTGIVDESTRAGWAYNDTVSTVSANVALCMDGISSLAPCTAATKTKVYGVSLQSITAASYGMVATAGAVRVCCSGSIAYGDLLETNDSGCAIKSTSPAIGAVLGKAWSTCSGGYTTAVLSLG